MRGGLTVIALTMFLAGPAETAAPPPWVRALTVPAAPAAGVGAQVLLREHSVSVPEHGRVSESERGALVVREPSGQKHAGCAVAYDRTAGELVKLRAWLISPSGHVQELDRSDARDYALLGPGALVSDQRVATLGVEGAVVGAIFAWEWTTTQEPLLAQWAWSFATQLPVVRSRFEITLPEGADVVAVGAPSSAETTHDGARWSWEMHDVPAIRAVPLGPERPGASSLLRISVRAHRGVAPAGAEFASWQDVGGWCQRLTDPQARADADLVAKAAELTRGKPDALARARAIAAFVQSTNYVAIDLGLGLGFGYRPRLASEVLKTGYGDCKDKANLMRALLQAAGQEAWLVAVYAGDRHRVTPEWPTVCQFNHCIVAMRTPGRGELPASDPASSLGNITYFDPTDPCTVFGDLPATLQGSYGLVQDARVTGLMRLPVAVERQRTTSRRIRATLASDGSIRGDWIEIDRGDGATRARCQRLAGESRLRERDEARLVEALHQASVSAWSVADAPESSRVERHVQFSAAGFARTSGSSLMSFAASVIPSANIPAFSDTGRVEPVELEPRAFEGEVRLEVPADWTPDELPSDRRVERDFGSIEATWKVEGREVVYRCHWRTEPLRLPAKRYQDVQEFFSSLQGAESAPAVLVRR